MRRELCGQNLTMAAPPSFPNQPRNPLHGLTLEAVVTALVAHYGWPGLGERRATIGSAAVVPGGCDSATTSTCQPLSTRGR